MIGGNTTSNKNIQNKHLKLRPTRIRDKEMYEDEYTESEFDGTYVHDVEGWSDDDIYDVLDGEADAYWNID